VAEKVTLKDIARETGYTVATVSRALSGKDHIAASTRDKIHAAAKRMAYQPDPALARLAAWRWGDRPPEQKRDTLAIITDCPKTKDPWFSRLRMTGAINHAKLLGYQVAVFRLRDYEYNAKRLAEVLRARGIRGVVIERVFTPGSYDNFPWEEFCAVGSGLGFERLPIPTVSSDLHEAIRILWHKARERGYRKIGVVTNFATKSDIYYRVLSAVRLEQAQSEMCEGEMAVPPLINQEIPTDTHITAAYENWLEQHQPDALLLSHQFYHEIIEEGLALPQGYACFDWNGNAPNNITCACQSLEKCGELAIELCHLDLQLPSWHGIRNPTLHLINPSFADGDTLPRISS